MFFMFCGNCGSPLKDGSKFCGKCGTPVKMITPAPETEIPVPEVNIPLPEAEIPAPEVNIPAPEIKLEEPVLEISQGLEIPEFDPNPVPVEEVAQAAPDEVFDVPEYVPEEQHVPEMPAEIPVEEVPEFVMPEQAVYENNYGTDNSVGETVKPEVTGSRPYTDAPKYDNGNYAANSSTVNSNSCVNNQEIDNSRQSGFTQAQYVTADFPEQPEKHKKAKKTKRPFFVALICGLFTFILSIILFVLMFALLVRTFFDGTKAQSDGSALYSDVSYMSAPVGKLINEIDKSVDLPDDAGLSDYIYEKLPSKDKENTSPKEIGRELEKAKLDSFIMDIVDDIGKGLSGEKDGPIITNDQIIDKIEDNQKAFETIIGRDMTDEDYKKIRKQLDKMELEKNTTIKEGSLKAVEEVPGLKLALKAITDPATAYALLGISIGVVLIFIVLFNLHKPSVFIKHAGSAAFCAGSVGLGLAIAFDLVTELINKDAGMAKLMIDMLFDGLKNVMMINSIIFMGAGFVLIIVYIIIRVIVKSKQVVDAI